MTGTPAFVTDRNLLCYPPDEGVVAERPWPTIIFLHGMGERGGPDALALVARWGLPALRRSGRRPTTRPFPFLVVVPQCPAEHTWADAPLLARLEFLIDDLVAGGTADPRRLYLTGFSMGGIGAFAMALRLPDRFAALVSVCGRCLAPERLGLLRDMPAWIAYAEDDEIEELTQGSRQAIAALAPFGRTESRPYRLGAADGQGAHVRTCEAAFADGALYTWLARQRR